MRSLVTVAQRTGWRGAAATLLLLSMSAAFPASEQPRPLALASTVWPPFTGSAGQPRFALNLVEAALGRIGVTAKTTIVGAPEFTAALLGGTFDGSGAAWKDAEREKVLIFSRSYLENRLVLVGRRGADVAARALGELEGKRIALVEGYSYSDAVDKAGPVFVRAQSEEDSLARLLKGEVDYTLVDQLVVQHIVGSYPKESAERLQIGTRALLTRDLHFAIRRDLPNALSLVVRFNEQLHDMIVDRTYHRLLHVNWIRADINGDGVPEYVPSSDKAGSAEPHNAYLLFSTPQKLPEPDKTEKPGFYVGGSIYSDWASVPNRYKAEDPNRPDPARSTGSIFRFTW